MIYYKSGKDEILKELETTEKGLDENESKRTNLAIKENLVEIREIAINQLGMTTPVEGQIIYYTSPSDKEIVQYQEIPENGFLPKGILSKRGS